LEYISDKIDFGLIDKRKFNIVASGTGTGKTHLVTHSLKIHFPNIKSQEIMVIASRSLIVDQQIQEEGIDKFFLPKNNISYLVRYWNGEEDLSEDILKKYNIQMMTYDKIIGILSKGNIEGLETLSKVKLIIFDECHTLFSDKFIKNIEMLKVWIRDTLYNNNKIIIGLTATPNILAYYQKEWGVTTNRLNKEILIKHKAKQLHCTNFGTIPYIVTNKIEGKTIIMCYSYMDCKKLKNKIPNSFVLISKSNKEFTKEMGRIRQFLVDNKSIPDTFIDDDSIEKELNVLITTSTLREGVNIIEQSGIKNVVCCFSDELHITQFAGRCRYNIDNLIIADTYINADNFDDNAYLTKCRLSYKTFMKNKDSTSWFDSIKHLVSHDVYEIKRFVLSADENKFIDYINVKWLVPKGINGNELNKYKIYKEHDKNEIVEMVIKCRLLKLYPYQITFNKVINFMEDTLGYTIENKRGKINKIKHTYKLVIDFDEEKVNFEKEEIFID
jgi:hypothetical protein